MGKNKEKKPQDIPNAKPNSAVDHFVHNFKHATWNILKRAVKKEGTPPELWPY